MGGIRHPEHGTAMDGTRNLGRHIALCCRELVRALQPLRRLFPWMWLCSRRDEQHRAAQLPIVWQSTILPERRATLQLEFRAEPLLHTPIRQITYIGMHNSLHLRRPESRHLTTHRLNEGGSRGIHLLGRLLTNKAISG